MTLIACISCGSPYPEDNIPHRCSLCGGIFDFIKWPKFDLSQIDRKKNGIWQYQAFFDLPKNADQITLGEGNTSLLWQKHQGHEIGFKLESLNPTGSYKDRASAVLLSRLRARGISSAVEDSSGNAGASFAAFAAYCGVKARIFVPDTASGPKKEQILRYGAQLFPIPGSREATSLAVLGDIKPENPYASHAYLPFGLPGIATLAYEIWEEMNSVPGTIIAPAGHGSLMLGILRGFSAIRQANLIDRLPYFIAVQSAGCAPMVAYNENRNVDISQITSQLTIAEGVRVRFPVRMNALVNEISISGGEFIAIREEEILPAFVELAHCGVYVEPTSALVWAAYKQLKKLPQPVILVMTGSGLKYT